MQRWLCEIYNGTPKTKTVYFFFAFALWKWLAHFFLLRGNDDIMRTLFGQKNNDIFHIFYQLRFEEYRCKSGIVIFEVTGAVPLKTLCQEYPWSVSNKLRLVLMVEYSYQGL